MAECLNKNGPAIIAGQADKVCTFVAEILDQKSACQVDSEAQDEEAAAEDNSEYESVLILAATDLVGAMANVYGQDFVEPLKQLLPKVTKYYSPSRSTSDRSMAVGSLGEIVTGMKATITPFTGDILSILSRALQDEDASVRSNAAFASGVLIENSQTDLSEHFAALLGAIRPMFEQSPAPEKDEVASARDNACGCLARMMTKRPDAIPMDQAMPVLLASLPLQKDMAEWTPVLVALMGRVQSNDAVATANIDKILAVFAHALKLDDAMSPQLRGQVVAFISAINASAPEKVAAAGLQPFLV